jgi:hypothetical protein
VTLLEESSSLGACNVVELGTTMTHDALLRICPMELLYADYEETRGSRVDLIEALA